MVWAVISGLCREASRGTPLWGHKLRAGCVEMARARRAACAAGVFDGLPKNMEPRTARWAASNNLGGGMRSAPCGVS
eukprot:1459300-Pyramimonas_sp.AAC.1